MVSSAVQKAEMWGIEKEIQVAWSEAVPGFSESVQQWGETQEASGLAGSGM